MVDVIGLTQKLISFNTINPPGNERIIAEFVGKLLSENGFEVKYPLFAENRLHVVAERGLSEMAPPIVLSGHFDTVPIGSKLWQDDPFSGKIIGNKIYGRGSSDMKAGLATMICAAIGSFEEGSPVGGVRLIFTAAEELGCQGVVQLAETYNNFGKASAIIIGEPTANIPAIGHKGALYLNVTTAGKTAHSSMPELVDLPPVSSSESSPIVQIVYEVCRVDPENGNKYKSLPYMTDGAVLQQLYGGIPTVILGPGQPEMAHQTDEFCYISKIEEAVTIYKNIILKNGGITNDKIS